MSAAPIAPPAWLGVVGGGQLGQMFIAAAHQLGYKVAVYTDAPDSPAAQVADRVTVGEYDDAPAVGDFAKTVQALTFEFENVSAPAAYAAAENTIVRPQPRILAIAQHRLHEKQHLSSHGFPTAPFHPVNNVTELDQALDALGRQAVFKTAVSGYDGHGQVRIPDVDDRERVLRLLDAGGGVLEGWIDFRCELSVIVARNPRGETATYGPMRNDHADHILDVSVVPALLGDEIEARAVSLATAIAADLGLEGLLCVEMFLTNGGELLVNELAPRPHNSGHLTIEACRSSQFDQQVRTLCGLDLGSTEFTSPAAAMVNLLGDLWIDGAPNPDAAQSETTFVHLYGKAEPRRRRKMGHITTLAPTPEAARQQALAARQTLRNKTN